MSGEFIRGTINLIFGIQLIKENLLLNNRKLVNLIKFKAVVL